VGVTPPPDASTSALFHIPDPALVV
jgi:hypothetical protein